MLGTDVIDMSADNVLMDRLVDQLSRVTSTEFTLSMALQSFPASFMSGACPWKIEQISREAHLDMPQSLRC